MKTIDTSAPEEAAQTSESALSTSGASGVVAASDEALQRLAEATARLVANGKSTNTRRTYRSYWKSWVEHCRVLSARPLPGDPTVLASWVAALAEGGKSVATMEVALAAVRDRHEQEGAPSPTLDPLVRLAMQGARRLYGKPAKPKKAMSLETLRKVSTFLRNSAEQERAARDRAMILLGWYAALRRSELVALRWADLEESEEGLSVTLRRSKTDQSGAGKVKGLLYQPDPMLCSIRALQRWRRVCVARWGHEPAPEGPVFVGIDARGVYGTRPLAPAAVAEIVKEALLAIGANPKTYAGHSLRRGFATEAARRGKRLEQIQRHMGHSAISTTARYVEEGTRFDESNPTHGLS